ncbi:MAG: GNAT family N-acetyltransferase [Verrucomicrobiota bacterium]
MFRIRTMRPEDANAVADLIYLSTNSWYQQNRGFSIFNGGPEVCLLFTDVYQDIDNGNNLVAEDNRTGNVIGSCFVHPRETHVSLGIMNVHPNHFGKGVASVLLDRIISDARARDLPVRLVSSAMNLDSYSLYTRKGFVPFALFQDMVIDVPEEGIETPEPYAGIHVREGELRDLIGMGQLEFEVAGISREQDYCYFIENDLGIWNTVVVSDRPGEVDGFLVSVDHPGSCMIGPGVARTPEIAAAMLFEQLKKFKGKKPVFLIPTEQGDLVQSLYAAGAKNCELHVAQVHGAAQPICGVVMPSFMPETG